MKLLLENIDNLIYILEKEGYEKTDIIIHIGSNMLNYMISFDNVKTNKDKDKYIYKKYMPFKYRGIDLDYNINTFYPSLEIVSKNGLPL